MKNIFITLAIFIFVAANLIFWWDLGGEQNSLLRSLIYLSSTFLSVAAGIFLVRTYGMKNQHGKAFLLITIGLVSWLIGECLWVFYDFVLQIDPYPSLADFFYLAAYPFIVWGLIKEIRIAEIKFKNVNKLVLAFCGVMSLIFIIAVGYFEIFVAYDPTSSLIDNLVVAYGFGDLSLAIPALLVLILAFEYKGGKIFTPWILVFLGLVLYLLADVLFAVFLDQYLEDVYPYGSMDLLWIGGYLLIALGLSEIAYLIRSIQKKLRV